MDQPINMLRIQISMDLMLAKQGVITSVPTLASSIERMTDLFCDELSEQTIMEELGIAYENAQLDEYGQPLSDGNDTEIDSKMIESD